MVCGLSDLASQNMEYRSFWHYGALTEDKYICILFYGGGKMCCGKNLMLSIGSLSKGRVIRGETGKYLVYMEVNEKKR